jgi:hypothetical protein
MEIEQPPSIGRDIQVLFLRDGRGEQFNLLVIEAQRAI